jgi:hypothetical protein
MATPVVPVKPTTLELEIFSAIDCAVKRSVAGL